MSALVATISQDMRGLMLITIVGGLAVYLAFQLMSWSRKRPGR